MRCARAVTALLVLGLTLSVTCVSTTSLAYPRVLIDCEALLNHRLSQLRAHLAQEHEGIAQAASALTVSRWVPRAPQLRGRIDQDQRRGQADVWSGRVGARLYLPSLTVDPSSRVAPGVSTRDLPKAWLMARRRDVVAQAAELHVAAREAWVELRSAQERAMIHEARHVLSRELEQAGALPARASKSARLQLDLAQLDQAQALSRWVSAASLIETLLDDAPLNQPVTPLQSVCAARPQTESAWNLLRQSPRQLSAEEAELLFDLYQRQTEHVRRRGRWIDFIEVSYDERGGDARWIAEVGVDLISLDPSTASERLKLRQIRAALREINDEATRNESKLRAQLSLPQTLRAPQSSLTRPELTQLPMLELYELEVSLWRRRWLHRLSVERTLIRWNQDHSAN